MRTLKILLIIMGIMIITCHMAFSADYEIYDWNDLDNVRNDLSGNYTLKADLSASGAPANWVPIGTTFSGTFDGGGHTISGLTMNYSGQDYIALFGHIGGSAVVKNVGLVDVDITSAPNSNQGHVAALVGYMANTASVENCFSTGTIAVTVPASGAIRFIGGLVGREYNGTSILNSYSTADISVAENGLTYVYFVAGLAGESRSADVDDSYSIGSITITNPRGSTANYKAGFVGVDTSQNGTSNWSENGWYDVSGDYVSSAVKPATPAAGAVPYDNLGGSDPDEPNNWNNKLAWIVGLDALGLYYFPSQIDLLVALGDGESLTIDGTEWTYFSGNPGGEGHDIGTTWNTGGYDYIQLATSQGRGGAGGGAIPEPATVISFMLGGAGLAAKRFFMKK